MIISPVISHGDKKLFYKWVLANKAEHEFKNRSNHTQTFPLLSL